MEMKWYTKYYSKYSRTLISLYDFVGIRNYAIINKDNALLQNLDERFDGTKINYDDDEFVR